MLAQHKTFKVLVADDAQSNRAVLRAYLGRLGFETVLAENGAQAVALFESSKPDILIIDLMMPVMDGFEAMRQIRSLPSERWVPIIIISAMDAEGDFVRGLECGADDYLAKPVSYQLFAAKMRNMARALDFQRTHEEALKRERTIADAVIDGIISFDASGNIRDLNRAARQIFKLSAEQLSGRHFASLIAEEVRPAFALALARSLEHGAGEFIGRVAEITACTPDGQRFPMELTISPLPTAERRLFIGVVRDISERKRVELQLAEDATRLRQYHDEAEAEAELAQDILERHIASQGQQTHGVRQCVWPTARFSGDIVLAARGPSGKLYGLLADATGHGLAAALSGLSVVNQFHQAVANEHPVARLVCAMNESLRALLPPGRFVSTAIVCIDSPARSLQIWLGGVPDVLRIDRQGRLVQSFSSQHLPLGIIEMEAAECEPETYSWQDEGEFLLLCSDGVLEAEVPGGEEFGQAGVLKALAGAGGQDALEALNTALSEHLQGHSAHDDVSFLLLDLA